MEGLLSKRLTLSSFFRELVKKREKEKEIIILNKKKVLQTKQEGTKNNL